MAHNNVLCCCSYFFLAFRLIVQRKFYLRTTQVLQRRGRCARQRHQPVHREHHQRLWGYCPLWNQQRRRYCFHCAVYRLLVLLTNQWFRKVAIVISRHVICISVARSTVSLTCLLNKTCDWFGTYLSLRSSFFWFVVGKHANHVKPAIQCKNCQLLSLAELFTL